MLASSLFSRTVLASLLSVLAVGCGGADEGRQYSATDADRPEAVGAELTVGCQEGAVQSCTIYLGRHGDLSNCVIGLEICSAGEWSECVDEGTMNDNPELYSELLGDSE